ncbi:hypothetical protein BKA67DRAFT_653935 [Truncatella angustata]|uniref:WW domain-containing protein n=1 Tax=Truncatella angustata TaxID=152316 RepID=A0A9P8UYN9_9PEZI|nr:uncharacterized protein BKA67DRAFT_653935 [Truncatella angustata]KAH6660778.1 hypothetical protein BKA67DRAFT_653935 [Truncatella angustata]KAH8203023.1 hypothetical protein TruAng_002857 [Truncatella angustata]
MSSPTTSSRAPEGEVAPSTDLSHDLSHDPAIAREVAAASREANPKRSAEDASTPESDHSAESGEVSPTSGASSEAERGTEAPPLPDEAPPLPQEAAPAAEDDGWDFHWDEAHQAYFFHNHITGQSTWENPRLSKPTTGEPSTANAAEPPKNEKPPAGGYNPAIHGDYDPNAWYAKTDEEKSAGQSQPVDPAAAYAAMGSFNRFTGRWQSDEQNPDQHNDENKSKRQMNAFFDVDAAANSHDGRSLKAERSGKKPSKTELKQFKEKRRAKKEEKRRAWLKD